MYSWCSRSSASTLVAAVSALSKSGHFDLFSRLIISVIKTGSYVGRAPPPRFAACNSRRERENAKMRMKTRARERETMLLSHYRDPRGDAAEITRASEREHVVPARAYRRRHRHVKCRKVFVLARWHGRCYTYPKGLRRMSG